MLYLPTWQSTEDKLEPSHIDKDRALDEPTTVEAMAHEAALSGQNGWVVKQARPDGAFGASTCQQALSRSTGHTVAKRLKQPMNLKSRI